MAAVDEIAIKLGIKTGDLKAALLDTNSQIKTFKKTGEMGEDEGLGGSIKKLKKSVNDFKDLLAAGGIAAAVKGFFQLAIDTANKSTDATDTSAAAVREFAQGLEEAKGVAGNFAVTAVGAFNKLGQAIGDAINIGRSFIENGTQGFEVWAKNQDILTATANAAEVAEKRLAETRKKHGAEFTAITKELESIEKRSQEQKLKGLTVYETERNVTMKLIELKSKLANSEGDVLEKRRLTLEIAKTQLAKDEATLAVKKDIAADQKRFNDEQKKAAEAQWKLVEEERKAKALTVKEEAELFTLQRKRGDELTQIERERLKVLMLQKESKAVQFELETLIAKKIKEGLTPEEQARLAVLIKQDEKLNKQLIAQADILKGAIEIAKAEGASTVELEKQLALVTQIGNEKRKQRLDSSVTRTGLSYDAQSQDALEGVRERLRKQVAEMEADTSFASVFSPNAKNPLLAGLKADLFAVEKELASRRQVQDTVAKFGEDAARRQFGDTRTDIGMREMQDATQKSAVTLRSIDQRLSKSPLFPGP